MEIQYGIKSITLPSACEKGDTRDSMNLLNETPENLNGEPRREDERERRNVCIIL